MLRLTNGSPNVPYMYQGSPQEFLRDSAQLYCENTVWWRGMFYRLPYRISVKEEAVLVREVITIILNSSYDVKDYCKGLLQITMPGMGVCLV